MTEMQTWIAVCHLQNRESNPAQDYVCQAAVRADSYDSFRTQLSTYLETTPYRLLWIEECHPALNYIRRHGQQHRIGNLARAVHPAHPVELGPLSAKSGGETAPPEAALSFRDALLALDHKTAPVFAVLDGAQFDNLPKALFDGDFISRPLYLDRGDNNPEQIITAPHMVTLDERAEKPTGRSYEDTAGALLDLTGDKPAAVFWQCPKGSEALYRHLRGINKIMIPKEDLPGGADDADEETASGETHAMVLFRHADANVIAQTLPALTAPEAARFFGPATALLFAPGPDWANGKDWLHMDRSDDWPTPKPGPLRLGGDAMERIAGARLKRRQKRIIAYLRKVAPEQTKKINDDKLSAAIAKYITEAEGYGVKSEAALGRWCYLQVISNEMAGRSDAVKAFMDTEDQTLHADNRVKLLLRETSRAMQEGKV